MGWTLSSVTNGQKAKQSKDTVSRVSGLVNKWRFGESGAPVKPHLCFMFCHMHLFCVAVLELKPFIRNGSVQSLCRVQLFVTPCTPGLPVHHQLPELAQTHVHRIGDAPNQLILCCPLLLRPSIFLSIKVLSNESVLCTRLPKYWSFSFGISPSNEYSGLISFRTDWFDLLAVQGTPKSLFQYHG